MGIGKTGPKMLTLSVIKADIGGWVGHRPFIRS